MTGYTFEASKELFLRAAASIPGAIPGHQSPALHVPGSVPYFAERASGCRYWDVDGNEYIDFMCGYGPIVLGYDDPAVERAAEEQRRKGQCFNHPTARNVELAEQLVALTPQADWATFARNGSDVTTWAVQVAREHTQRKKVIMARGAYHGARAWCTPGHHGLIEEDRAHTLLFDWNDADQLADLMRRHDGQIAALILTPYHHPAFADSVLPAPGFYDRVHELCQRYGVVFILDDIRACFRLHIGGSAEFFGAKPDIICYSKALANGYTLSAALGTDEVKGTAAKIYFAGSFFNCAIEMAAAMATLDQLAANDGIAKMLRLGEMLQTGLRQRATAHGLQVTVSGPPSIPYLSFANEKDFRRMQLFCASACERGVFFHPHHNWFLSAAHEQQDIQQALEVADECFGIVKAEFGG